MKNQRAVIFQFLILLTTFGSCTDPEETVSPLSGSWKAVAPIELRMKYVASNVTYDRSAYITAGVGHVLTLSNSTDATRNDGYTTTKYTYSNATVNGEKQLILTDQKTAQAAVYAWSLDGSTLTLVSKNYLNTFTSSDKVTGAKLWAASSPANFPNYASMTRIDDMIFTTRYSKQ